MKDKSSDDDRPNGNDPAPPPIRKNAKGKYHQASQCSDFDKSQGPPPPCETYRVQTETPPVLHRTPPVSVRQFEISALDRQFVRSGNEPKHKSDSGT